MFTYKYFVKEIRASRNVAKWINTYLWQKEWEETTKEAIAKEFFSKRRKQTGSEFKTKPKCNNYYDRPWTIRSYFHRLKIVGSPECPCKHGTQTVDHLIFQCKMLKNEKEMMKNGVLKVGNWPVSKSELTNKNLKQLTSYINSMDLEKLHHSNEQM